MLYKKKLKNDNVKQRMEMKLSNLRTKIQSILENLIKIQIFKIKKCNADMNYLNTFHKMLRYNNQNIGIDWFV